MVSQKRFSQSSPNPYAKRPKTMNSQAARLRALESRVSTNKPEIQIRTNFVSVQLGNPSSPNSSGLQWGVMNQLGTADGPQGREYKTVSVKASLAEDAALASAVLYRYRMILFSNKNNSSLENTQARGPGPVPEAYGLAGDPIYDPTLNFDIDMRRFAIYDDKKQKNDLFGADPQSQIGYGGLTVKHTFTKPKICKIAEENAVVTGFDLSKGAIGLVVYRQNMESGAVERVTADAVDAPKLNVELKWMDP